MDGGGPCRASYAQLGKRAAQLSHALRGLGVDGDQRVATFMWNNEEHLTAYLTVPSMGVVCGGAFIAEVPKTSVGECDKKVLREQYAKGNLQVSLGEGADPWLGRSRGRRPRGRRCGRRRLRLCPSCDRPGSLSAAAATQPRGGVA